MFISLLESVKAKFVFCSIKIQYYLSFLINSCFDQFRLLLCSWVLIKVALRSSFLEIRSSLIIFDYILICKLCTFVNTTLLAKIIFCSFKAQMKCFWYSENCKQVFRVKYNSLVIFSSKSALEHRFWNFSLVLKTLKN